MTFDLICVVPFEACHEFTFYLILLYLMSTHLDIEVNRLPPIDGMKKLKEKIKKEFLESVHNLKRIKKVVSQEER